ncbi:MAG: radical SAM family heme chaperone HemW [Planctomycetaceae bacterium]|nr:MAG: radical SAM family heme chaperone HemW [Planctomycetaceae bacterium]
MTADRGSVGANWRDGRLDGANFSWPIPQSAYVHVPFCRHRCGYCHFSVLPGRLDLADPYLDALEVELATLGEPTPVRTLFIGGGTPTRLPSPQLDRLFDLLGQWLPMVEGGELSVEANPEDIDLELLRQLARRGVNRVSLGVQSFAAAKLRMLQRGHDRRVATAAIEAAAREIGNVSIDLIFAAPDETPEAWRADLETAVALPISHLSTYSLTYEKGTEFWGRRFKGELSTIEEEDEVQMYRDARRIAEAAGLGHYEISNFARLGKRCAHNLAYWQGLGWLAMGPGAARFVEGRREVNHRSPTTYIRRLQQGQSPVAESEPITPIQWACERAAFGIRMLDGIDLDGIRRETGVCVASLRSAEIERCLRHGWLTVKGTHYRLTEAGLLMADGVAAAFL